MTTRIAAPQLVVTVGPATWSDEAFEKLARRNVSYVRTNMSHSSLADLKAAIAMAQRAGIPFMLDTEGSQVRTGELIEDRLFYEEGAKIRITRKAVVGNNEILTLRPGSVLGQIQPGDLIHIDFDTLILRVTDTSTIEDDYISANAITRGFVGRNKAVVIDPVVDRRLDLPPLSQKDVDAIQIALDAGVEHIAVSFARSGAAVREVRRITEDRMQIISKIECIDALENIDDIIEASDGILIDRGDLSKEIPIERIPFTQKILIDLARQQGREAFVATNLLETMIEKRKPTRAEIQDIVNTILDGATGLTLAAETAIGEHPIECVNMINRLIDHTQRTLVQPDIELTEPALARRLHERQYLLDHHSSSALIAPHGGRLVNRTITRPDFEELEKLPKLHLDADRLTEVEQIGVGTFSPLTGFMGSADLDSVAREMRLTTGILWPIPVLLDIDEHTATRIGGAERVALTDDEDRIIAVLNVEEAYRIENRRKLAKQIFGTDEECHPGTRQFLEMRPVCLAGPIDLVQRRPSATAQFELSPRQVRHLFEERGWATVLGFHTRNVIHRAHEHIQLTALRDEGCDGLFVHPVVGKKKSGDFRSKFILRSYERMIDEFYPAHRVIFAAFPTFSRYAGPREALFTAICRQNYGCSHFIIGRDHTGVGTHYGPWASQEIFERVSGIEIKPVFFPEVRYHIERGEYVQLRRGQRKSRKYARSISGSEARELFESGKAPPEWFMRPEIAEIIREGIEQGDDVFV